RARDPQDREVLAHGQHPGRDCRAAAGAEGEGARTRLAVGRRVFPPAAVFVPRLGGKAAASGGSQCTATPTAPASWQRRGPAGARLAPLDLVAAGRRRLRRETHTGATWTLDPGNHAEALHRRGRRT